MTIPIYQADAFTDRLFSGNPAAVCPLDSWLPDSLLQAIAAENNLSETAFFVSHGLDFDLRWFTPLREVDLCGHATLASAFIIFEKLAHPGHIIRFNSRSGLLSVSREGSQLTLDFPADRPEKQENWPAALSEGLAVTPKAVYRGISDFLVILENESEVRQITADFRVLAEVNTRGIIVSAPGDEVDFISRFFAPRSGINEDPVTGSAHTTLTPYWADVLGRTNLKARQISARGGYLTCRLSGERVLISGKCTLYLEGRIEVVL
ncbi:MAG TPA: PhzF family phenazine biosynthesis protein [Chitinophagaceae bacterium]|nr:PhzF family phenazine biosynthesis protein [Chitinophagaceae bacterium]